jgi:hypothetical protein
MVKDFSKKIVLATLLTFSSGVALAENAPAKPAVTQASNKTLETAKKLVNIMQLNGSYEETINKLTDGLIRRFPQLASVKGKILNFYKKYIGWDVIKDDVAKIYAKHFNEKELNDMIKFYESPTGQKTLKQLPSIMMEARELGMKRVSAHMKELEEIIKEGMQKKK